MPAVAPRSGEAIFASAERVSIMVTLLMQRVDTIEERPTTMEAKLTAIDGKFGSQEAKLKAIEGKFDTQKATIGRVV
uniref:Uncharacterized protein n=1 Tax=Chenopodium quinoa TaxID=63459 RepID=A0A803L6L7_CHEQI